MQLIQRLNAYAIGNMADLLKQPISEPIARGIMFIYAGWQKPAIIAI